MQEGGDDRSTLSHTKPLQRTNSDRDVTVKSIIGRS